VKLKQEHDKNEHTIERKKILPSPKPKHGIKLSSSNGDKVRPIIDMACSYGF
jgi:hypothetical protein